MSGITSEAALDAAARFPSNSSSIVTIGHHAAIIMQLQLVASPEADVGRPRRVDVGVGRSSQSLKTGGRFSWRARTASSKLRVVMRTSSWAFISERMWAA